MYSRKSKIFIIILSVTMLSSCDDDQHNLPDDNSFASVFGVQDYQKAIEVMGDYAIFGTNVNGGVLIRHDVVSLRQENNSRSSIFVSYLPNMSEKQQRTDGGDYTVNGEIWQFSNGSYNAINMDEDESQKFAGSLFGEEITINVSQGNNNIVNVGFTAPQTLLDVEVHNTEYVDMHSSTKWFPRNKSVRMTWNSDDTNPNGLLVVLAYTGEKMNEIQRGPKVTKYEVLHIEEDDGEISIPEQITSGLSSKYRYI